MNQIITISVGTEWTRQLNENANLLAFPPALTKPSFSIRFNILFASAGEIPEEKGLKCEIKKNENKQVD